MSNREVREFAIRHAPKRIGARIGGNIQSDALVLIAGPQRLDLGETLPQPRRLMRNVLLRPHHLLSQRFSFRASSTNPIDSETA